MRYNSSSRHTASDPPSHFDIVAHFKVLGNNYYTLHKLINAKEINASNLVCLYSDTNMCFPGMYTASNSPTWSILKIWKKKFRKVAHALCTCFKDMW